MKIQSQHNYFKNTPSPPPLGDLMVSHLSPKGITILNSTYYAVMVFIPQETCAVAPGRAVHIEDQGVHAVVTATQALKVGSHSRLHHSREHCLWRLLSRH